MKGWWNIAKPVGDVIGRIFGVIDRVVEDKDAANKLKVELVRLVTASKIFDMVMAANFALLAALTLMGREPPVWTLAVFLVWATGPLLNSLSKETVGRIWEIIKQHQKEADK